VLDLDSGEKNKKQEEVVKPLPNLNFNPQNFNAQPQNRGQQRQRGLFSNKQIIGLQVGNWSCPAVANLTEKARQYVASRCVDYCNGLINTQNSIINTQWMADNPYLHLDPKIWYKGESPMGSVPDVFTTDDWGRYRKSISGGGGGFNNNPRPNVARYVPGTQGPPPYLANLINPKSPEGPKKDPSGVD
jgi:hypothetical protein